MVIWWIRGDFISGNNVYTDEGFSIVETRQCLVSTIKNPSSVLGRPLSYVLVLRCIFFSKKPLTKKLNACTCKYMSKCDLYKCCLYFSSARLSRLVEGVAEEEFSVTGLSPSHAFLIMTVYKQPGITPMELGEEMYLAPSTVTRLADKLEQKELITRTMNGRNSHITLTEKGKAKNQEIIKAWSSLYERLNDMLGKKLNEDFTAKIFSVCEKMEK
jgi:MarR family transcriptional regulator, organic hydroperoxide resistance regulator